MMVTLLVTFVGSCLYRGVVGGEGGLGFGLDWFVRDVVLGWFCLCERSYKV